MCRFIKTTCILLSGLGIIFFPTFFFGQEIGARASSEAPFFISAKPIWPVGKEREMNMTVGFLGRINKKKDNLPVILKITASSIYRCYVNGVFAGYGPARAAHAYYRVDEINVGSFLKPDSNVIAIEVAGYNVNSFYTLDQASFLQAEVLIGNTVVLGTGNKENGFKASVLKDRVQKTQRYSFQRSFTEFYKLSPGVHDWRISNFFSEKEATCVIQPEKKLLPRRVPFPEFRIVSPLVIHSEGKIKNTLLTEEIVKDRSLRKIGPTLKGFKEEELEFIPSIEFQKIKNSEQKILDEKYEDPSLRLRKSEFTILDFGTNLTGFIGVKLTCDSTARFFFVFDEILDENDVNTLRWTEVVNIVSYELKPGEYEIETFEPYTLRFLKLVVLSGSCSIDKVYLREYVNPDTQKASFRSSDEKINKIATSGTETYRQNTVDLFMDCPSRERAGWLCDSRFTAKVAFDIAGNSIIEKNFFENFALAQKFDSLPKGMIAPCYPADHYDGLFIPNWAMWFIVQAEEYYGRSGDSLMIKALKPKIIGLLDYFKPFLNEDGLLENLKGWVFVEWSKANDFTTGVNYPSNMLYSAALEAAGRLYKREDLWMQGQRIKKIVNEQSFNGNFFVDNALRNKEGKITPTNNTSEVCQYYAFYLDVATPEIHKALWQTLVQKFGPGRDDKMLFPDVYKANAFIGNYLRIELLSRYGLINQLLNESKDFFYYMAERTGTLWENTSTSNSCNHGFASYINHIFYKDILGVNAIDYLKKTVKVRFSALDIKQCEGEMPIGNKKLFLKWYTKGEILFYSLKLPEGFSVEIENLSGLTLQKL